MIPLTVIPLRRRPLYIINNIIIFFISTWHQNITKKSFLSLLSERREMRASKNAVLGLGVGSNPGPLARESWVLPCAPLHIHIIFIFWCTDVLVCLLLLIQLCYLIAVIKSNSFLNQKHVCLVNLKKSKTCYF
jgi:hypothetical protein